VVAASVGEGPVTGASPIVVAVGNVVVVGVVVVVVAEVVVGVVTSTIGRISGGSSGPISRIAASVSIAAAAETANTAKVVRARMRT